MEQIFEGSVERIDAPADMCDLRTLWDISNESFRSLLESHLGRRHVALPGEDVSPPELAAPMPGDGLIPVPDRVQMRAVIIDVPAAEVWPWLAQMMRGAGIYGWPRLESDACASAEAILDQLPAPRIGDRVGELFELVVLDPSRAVVWRSCGPITVLGLTVREVTLSYQLIDLNGSRSRLLARQRCCLDQQAQHLARRLSNLIHFLLPCSQLRCIKDHAEATAALGAATSEQLNGRLYQAAPFHQAGHR